MASWTLRPSAATAARAIRRAASAERCYHADGAPARKLWGPRFSPLNRHNHEVDALLEEIKKTPVSMISNDLIVRTMRHSILARQQILVQNALRSWVLASAVILGYCWGYNKVAVCSAIGSEPPKGHEAK